mmetsp:Transcript_3814/g.8916  ORF Transcript_3814/g.8916 Transcript_3814/m.8916 type:complete len:246 (+) Transcript_3814:1117-1854(+)
MRANGQFAARLHHRSRLVLVCQLLLLHRARPRVRLRHAVRAGVDESHRRKVPTHRRLRWSRLPRRVRHPGNSGKGRVSALLPWRLRSPVVGSCRRPRLHLRRAVRRGARRRLRAGRVDVRFECAADLEAGANLRLLPRHRRHHQVPIGHSRNDWSLLLAHVVPFLRTAVLDRPRQLRRRNARDLRLQHEVTLGGGNQSARRVALGRLHSCGQSCRSLYRFLQHHDLLYPYQYLQRRFHEPSRWRH